MQAKKLRRLLNFWPPYVFSGIKVDSIRADYQYARVSAHLRWYNRNYVKTHFGGTLFSMTDPFHMLMLMNILGKGYYVWDKTSRIEFVRPGKGTVHAEFSIAETDIAAIIKATAEGEKYHAEFDVEVLDSTETLVAQVHKTIYIRQKPVKQ